MARPGAGIHVTLTAETQGEAIGWAADGKGFYTASEWDGQGPQPLYYYAFSVPEPASWRLAVGGVLAISVGNLLHGLEFVAERMEEIAIHGMTYRTGSKTRPCDQIPRCSRLACCWARRKRSLLACE